MSLTHRYTVAIIKEGYQKEDSGTFHCCLIDLFLLNFIWQEPSMTVVTVWDQHLALSCKGLSYS